jgi:hypothetical protein
MDGGPTAQVHLSDGQDPAYRATLLLITLCDFILITIWAAVFIFVLIFNYLMVDDKGDSIYSGPFLFSQPH